MKNVLSQAVKNANFIKSPSLSSYLCNIPPDKIGTAYKTLLMHNEV